MLENAAYSGGWAVRTLAAAVVGVAVAIDSAEGPIAAAGLREGTARLSTATAAAAAAAAPADCSPVAVAANSPGGLVDPGSLAKQPDAATVRRDAEPGAPSP